jgi:hypothetical protein
MAALAAGIAPDSAEGRALVDELAAKYSEVFGRPDDAALREWLLHRLEVADDPRVEGYWRLLSEINGWTVPESMGPVFEWFTAGVRARIG